MKTRRVLVAGILAFTFLAAVSSFAQQTYRFQIPADNEPYYGTWFNKEYTGPRAVQKRIYYSWGYIENFHQVADEKASSRATFILVEKWIDAKGNTWYRVLEQALGGKGYVLSKISKDGKMIEQIWRSSGFPAESDLTPQYPNYWTYRRL